MDLESEKVWVGRHVELEILYSDGDVERLHLDVVPDSAADFEKGFLGESTPLSQSILGQAVGSIVTYQAGKVRILSVSQLTVHPPEDASRRREESIQNAVENSNRTSVMLFASSFNGKWGDYDPGALLDEEIEKKPPQNSE